MAAVYSYFGGLTNNVAYLAEIRLRFNRWTNGESYREAKKFDCLGGCRSDDYPTTGNCATWTSGNDFGSEG